MPLDAFRAAAASPTPDVQTTNYSWIQSDAIKISALFDDKYLSRFCRPRAHSRDDGNRCIEYSEFQAVLNLPRLIQNQDATLYCFLAKKRMYLTITPPVLASATCFQIPRNFPFSTAMVFLPSTLKLHPTTNTKCDLCSPVPCSPPPLRVGVNNLLLASRFAASTVAEPF